MCVSEHSTKGDGRAWADANCSSRFPLVDLRQLKKNTFYLEELLFKTVIAGNIQNTHNTAKLKTPWHECILRWKKHKNSKTLLPLSLFNKYTFPLSVCFSCIAVEHKSCWGALKKIPLCAWKCGPGLICGGESLSWQRSLPFHNTDLDLAAVWRAAGCSVAQVKEERGEWEVGCMTGGTSYRSF